MSFNIRTSAIVLGILFGCLGFKNLVLAQSKGKAWQFFNQDKDSESAQVEIDKVVASEKGKIDPEAWYYRGIIYKHIYDDENLRETYKDKDVDFEAIHSFQKCSLIDKRKDFISSYKDEVFQLALDFVGTGNKYYEEANRTGRQEAYMNSIKFFDGFMIAYNLLGIEQNQINKTLKESDLDYNQIVLHNALAKTKVGKYDEAQQDYQSLLKSKFIDAQVYTGLSQVFMAKNEPDKASEILAQGMARLPESIEISLAYAQILAQNKQYTQAISIAQKASKTDKSSAMPHVVLGQIYEQNQQFDKAEVSFSKAISTEPESFEAAHRYGAYFERRAAEAKTAKQDAKAKQFWRSAIIYLEAANRTDPRNQSNLKLLYKCFIETENERKAEQIKSRITD